MKKKLQRMLAFVLCLMMTTGCLVGCGGSGNAEKEDGEEEESNGIVLNEEEGGEEVPEGRTEVVYWGTWGADNKAYIQSVIDSYNASQSTYYVTMQYVGTMDDLNAKLQVTEKNKLPALINTTTEMTGAFMYSDWITPIYELAGEDEQEYLDRIYGNLVATWGNQEGQLLGYPMGNSMTGIYFNMDILGEAGIDPYEDVKCVEDLYEVSKRLMDGGYVSNKAIGFEHTIRFMNYCLAMEGVDAYNNDNGLSAVPTECYYNTSPVKELCEEFLRIYKQIQDEGLCYTMGASWGNELLPAYAVGDIAILTGTIGGYGRLKRAWNDTNQEPMNTVFLPWIPITEAAVGNSGQCASGNGFYVIDNEDAEAQRGAWEFIKYFCSGENFAGWCVLTGYLPIADDILETDTYQKYMQDNPNLGLEYLMEVQRKDTGDTYHPISAVYTETSAIGLDKFNLYLSGTDIDTVLSEMQSEINDALTMWSMSNGY